MRNKKSLFIGYGNPDRGDDGAAYHILIKLLENYGSQDIDLFSTEVIHLSKNIDLLFNFQLLPEYAEIISDYQQVIFIDAHTGEIEEDIRFIEIKPDLKHSPFTHHFAPSTCLSLAQSITGRHPKSWLLSIRGFDFGFNRQLSKNTTHLVEKAVEILISKFIR